MSKEENEQEIQFRKCSDSVRSVHIYLQVCMRQGMGSDVKMSYEACKAKPSAVRERQVFSIKVQRTGSSTAPIECWQDDILFSCSRPAWLRGCLLLSGTHAVMELPFGETSASPGEECGCGGI